MIFRLAAIENPRTASNLIGVIRSGCHVVTPHKNYGIFTILGVGMHKPSMSEIVIIRVYFVNFPVTKYMYFLASLHRSHRDRLLWSVAQKTCFHGCIQNKFMSSTIFHNNTNSLSLQCKTSSHAVWVQHGVFGYGRSNCVTVIFVTCNILTAWISGSIFVQRRVIQNISKGSVATQLRCGGIFSDSITTNFLLILTEIILKVG